MLSEEAKRKLEEFRKKPYPKLENVMKNPYYAKLLYDDMAGNLGELSAVTQYIYEEMNWIEKKELSDILLEIAIMEMKHLNLLGNLIKQLGLSPKYISSSGTPWSARNVRYHTGEIKDMMRYNIFSEEVAISGYQKAIQRTNNSSIKALLERIIEEEELHKEIFKEIAEKD